jgi:hypothetical protein
VTNGILVYFWIQYKIKMYYSDNQYNENKFYWDKEYFSYSGKKPLWQQWYSIYLFIYLFIYLYSVLGFELKVLWLLDSCFITWVVPLALFTLNIFEIGTHSYAQASLDCGLQSFYLCFLHIWIDIHTPPRLAYWLDGVLLICYLGCLKSKFSWSLPPN